VSLQQRNATDRVLADRERYVARGVSTPNLVVARAEGARIWDVDGRQYIDFAGGIASNNLGHRPDAVVEAIHAQAEQYLHQCFVVGIYEPYVEVCRRLAEISPCRGADQKSVLVNSGAEALENAVKIARSYTGRPAVLVFDNSFHGRTLLTMSMTAKIVPYKKTFGPFAPEIYRAPVPYPYHGISDQDAIDALQHLFKAGVDPDTIACAVLEPVQGEGGFIPMSKPYLQALREILDVHGILFVADEVQSGCGRTGPMWAIEQFDVQPDLITIGKSIGGGLPLAAVTGDGAVMDAAPVGGLGGTFGGNPLSCAAALAVLDELPKMRERADELGVRIRERLERIAPAGSDVRGLGPMLAIELPARNGEEATRITKAAHERGLVLLSCGTYGNVLRLLPPLTVTDDELERGLDILEACLAG
jgi:4-aminobutyrate aminotransferase/(S)-3-amino-2-methylpropionate transaminase